jgi:hypothetical protein
MLAWAIRYALFAYGNGGDLSFMLIIGIAHGICYDFFFSGQYIPTQKRVKNIKCCSRSHYISHFMLGC